MKKTSSKKSPTSTKPKKKFVKPVLVMKLITEVVSTPFSVFANYSAYDYTSGGGWGGS